MKNLILHIGSHKTATTAIQDVLEKSRETLAKDSVWYARTNREPHPQLSKHTSLFRSLVGTDEDFAREKQILTEEFAESGCETLVLSEEGLSEPRFEQFERLKQFADNFNITTICFLRRQDIFLESLWNQFCRQGNAKKNILKFSEAPFNLERLRYARILDFWSEFSTVKAIDYEVAKKNGVVSTFSEMAGFQLEDSAEFKNVSPGMNCAAALAILNRSDLPFIKPKLLRAFREDKAKYALGSLRRTELLDKFSEENQQLQEKYGVSFDMALPEERPKPLNMPDQAALAKALSFLAS